MREYLEGLLIEAGYYRTKGYADRLALVDAEILRVRKALGLVEEEPEVGPVQTVKKATTRKRKAT